MKVQVVYTTHCKDAKLLAEDIARYARTYARPTTEFNFDEDIDLLVLGFEEYPCVKDKDCLLYTSEIADVFVQNDLKIEYSAVTAGESNILMRVKVPLYSVIRLESDSYFESDTGNV